APARAAARGSASRRGATVERGGAGLEAWVRHALALARPRGTLTIVHRADRLDDLLAALVGRAGSIVVFPLWPGRDDRPAKRVLVSARVGSRAPLRLVPGLVLHEPGGRYSDRAESVLRHGAPLELA
ncbi:MAG: methyltransferase, partial [Alphaproteobacteria bacterium]